MFQMGTVKDLIKFRGWKQLVELKLEGNPFIETLSDYQGYRIVEPTTVHYDDNTDILPNFKMTELLPG